MAFTVRDFHDLVEIMETQPIWRAEMRRLVLTEDILNLPQEIQALSRSVAELAEISKRNDERFAKLTTEIAASDARNEARFIRIESDITEIKSDGSTLKSDVSTLKSDVSTLKGDVSTLKSDVSTLKSDVSTLKGDVSTLKSDVGKLKNDVADLKGDNLERQVNERAFAYLSRFARRVKLVEGAERVQLIEDALDEERISEAEAEELKLADLVAWGQDREVRTDLYLVGEVSWTVAESDIARALTRATLFQKATGVKTMPVVLGKAVPDNVRTQAITAGISWVVLPE